MKYTSRNPNGVNQVASSSVAVAVLNTDVAVFTTSSLTLTGSLTASSAIISGNVTVLGTASINNLVVNQTKYSSGSNQLGDGLEDTQTLFGTVRIPTGSLTVTGSSIMSGSLNVTGGITGSLFGTASFANTASFVNPLTQSVSIRGTGTTSATTTLRVENANTSASLVVNNAGSVLIGTAIDAGFKLDVNGTTRLQNNVIITNPTLDTTKAIDIQSGAFFVQSNGYVQLAGIGISGGSTEIRPASANNDLYLRSSPGRTLYLQNTSFTPISVVTVNVISLTPTFSTSVNATMNGFLINPTINQTGVANGITRGIYVNPTLTSAADFRAIETTSGSIIFGGNTSVTITGSLTVVTGSSIELQVTNTGVKIGNNISDIHPITGSITVSGSITGSFSGSGIIESASFASTASFVNPLTQNVSIRGLGTTNATNGLKIQNSAGTDAFEVRDDAAVKIGPGSYGHPSITRFQVNDTLGNSVLRLDVTSLFVPQNLWNLGTGGLIVNGNPGLTLRVGNGNGGTITIGNNTNTVAFSNITRNFVLLNQNWNAISGSSNLTMNALVLNNTINFESSSGTNIFRGLHVDPILTGVTDFRAIETTTGSIIFGGNTSVTVTGSLTVVTGSSIELQVTQTGVKIGNATTDIHPVTGSLRVTGSMVIHPTSSGTPLHTGTDGEYTFGTDSGNYYIYVWMNGAWRSGSLS